jgi:hypothetical protein
LIEQHQQRQSAFRRRHPVVEFAARRGLMRIEKVFMETPIEIGVLGEPRGRAGLPPELDHLGCGHGRHPGAVGWQVSAGMIFLFNVGPG